MSDNQSRKLAEHQRDVAAGRFGNVGSGNRSSPSYKYGAKLGGRDPNNGRLLDTSTNAAPGVSGPEPISSPARTPAEALGVLIALLGVLGFFLFQANDNMRRTAETRARVAPAAQPTHFVTNGDAAYFYATGSRKGQPVSAEIVEPRAGKCFDLGRIRQSPGTVTVDVENHMGRVYRVYTNGSNFAPLPGGAECRRGYYRRS